jgi:aryl-alcohol dehydrogenase-like predicted oxidoreductase
METRKLRSLEVSALGLGCMGMSNVYGKSDEKESIRTLHRALELGVTLIDTADVYGNGHNEELVGKALQDRRNRAVLATKFGNVRKPDGSQAIDGRPEYVRQACEASLKRLGIEVIDLYYQHRVDPEVAIEETVGAMAKLVEEGKVMHLGLSEAGAGTIRRAQAIHPIAALQSEYSLWTRDPEPEILPTCRELGIAFVAYSPLGRGFLSGTVDSLAEGDRRLAHPRFAEEHRARNRALVQALEHFAARKGGTPAQIALAWLLAQGDDIIPIPGTKRIKWLEENVGAVDIHLSDDEIATLTEAFPPGAASGERYPAGQLKRVGL